MKTKLSDRVRPNSEAAPWVIDEIKKLEAELQVADEFYKAVVAERNHAWKENYQLREQLKSNMGQINEKL